MLILTFEISVFLNVFQGLHTTNLATRSLFLQWLASTLYSDAHSASPQPYTRFMYLFIKLFIFYLFIHLFIY